MIFHEIYSIYYDAVTRVLQAAAAEKIFRKKQFSDVSVQLKLPGDVDKLLLAGFGIVPDDDNMRAFEFFEPDGTPRITRCPESPLTIPEKRWLKTILCDPRIQLFDISNQGLEDVEPYYLPRDFVVFDREGDGDPWTDEGYIKRFRTILSAMQNEQSLCISWLSRESLVCSAVCRPDRFEYSELDDRMRLWANTDDKQIKVTLARVLTCEISDMPLGLEFPPELTRPLPVAGARELEQEKRENIFDNGDECPERLMIEITNDKNTLERSLFHFSHFQKQEIISLGDNRYRLVMSIDFDDREELVNRVISFGPYLHIVEPQWLIAKVRERLEKQMLLTEIW